MCQTWPGPRCYNDSSKKLNKVALKLDKANEELVTTQKTLTFAAKKSDFNTYAKMRQQLVNVEKKVETLETTHRYIQRDVDSTLTGRKALDKAVQNAKTTAELNNLDIRRRTAEALRFNREHALKLAQTGYVPAIRFAVAS